ncbi:MAG: hypothetical protein ACLQUY_01050 [Ktedonobacterales bacterium]
MDLAVQGGFASSNPLHHFLVAHALLPPVVQPLIQEDEVEYAMFERWTRYPWVLDTYRYQDPESLLANVKECVIDPAEHKANEILPSVSRSSVNSITETPPDVQ